MCSLWATFSLYIQETWPLGKPCGIKMRCYMQRFGGQLGNNGEPHGNTLGTWWEQEKKKKYSFSSFPERKKLDLSWVHNEPCIGRMELLFRKLFVTDLAWANGMEQPQKRKKKKFPPPKPPPKKEKTGPLVNACWAFQWLHCNFSFQNCLPPFLAWTNSPS